MPPEALKLLERMRRSKAGWKRKDLDTLYKGFGFTIRHGANHDMVSHPDYPQLRELRETLPRNRKLNKYLVQRAVKKIDKLIELQEAEQERTDEEHEDDE